MAHLARCWCGKVYRCETDHSPPPGVIRCFEDHWHDQCPDFILHGPRFAPTFVGLTSEKFVIPAVADQERISDIIESNSVKLPPDTVMPWKYEKADLEET